MYEVIKINDYTKAFESFKCKDIREVGEILINKDPNFTYIIKDSNNETISEECFFKRYNAFMFMEELKCGRYSK